MVVAYLSAVGCTMRRDVAIFLSYRFRFVSQMLTMLCAMTMFYYVSRLVRVGVVGPRADYFAYVVVGIVSLTVLTAALNAVQLVRAELLTGSFERVVLSPFGPVAGVVSLLAFPVAYAIAQAGLMFTVAAVVFRFPILLGGIPAAMAVAGLAAVAFGALGMLFVAMLLAFKSASGASYALGALSILGGVYFPVALFPGWLRWISEVQPFTPTLEVLRHLLLGTSVAGTLPVGLGKLAGFAVVLAPLAVGALWLAVRHSRRRGTLLEY